MNIPIILDPRVHEWYTTTADGQCKAIIEQGYLIEGSERNIILHDVMIKNRCSQQEAIKIMIRAHQLPFSLIRAILTYLQPNPFSTVLRTSYIALVCYKSKGAEIYYQAEITGEIKNSMFYIWHSFLRTLNDITEYENTVPEMETITEHDHIRDPNNTITLGEDNWSTQEEHDSVSIFKKDEEFVLFKPE